MLYGFKNTLSLPPYNALKELEGKGSYAVRKYYKFPYRFFYRKKLRLIVKMLGNKKYYNILDYGSGSGIFTQELKKHATFVHSVDRMDIINPLWKFEVIVCASVLEFCYLDHTLKILKSILRPNGMIIAASPMNTWMNRLYFNFIKDTNVRHSHAEILSKISKYFKIEDYTSWMGLYFCLKAR